MEQIFGPTEGRFIIFIFALLRCTGFMTSAPLFNNNAIPVRYKAGASAWMAFLIASTMEPFATQLTSVTHLVLIAMGELAIGLALGLIGQVLFSCIQLGGEVIGQQSGFAIASVLDPTTNRDVALMAQVNTLLAMIVFLAIDGHRVFLAEMLRSFKVVTPGTLTSFTELAKFARGGLEVVPMFFTIGIKIAAPVAVTMICVSTSEAIIAKTAPQVNILMIGFGTRLLMGVFMLITALPFIYRVFSEFVMRYDDVAGGLMKSAFTGGSAG